jgi:hypothetical protein
VDVGFEDEPTLDAVSSRGFEQRTTVALRVYCSGNAVRYYQVRRITQ